MRRYGIEEFGIFLASCKLSKKEEKNFQLLFQFRTGRIWHDSAVELALNPRKYWDGKRCFDGERKKEAAATSSSWHFKITYPAACVGMPNVHQTFFLLNLFFFFSSTSPPFLHTRARIIEGLSIYPKKGEATIYLGSRLCSVSV